MKRMKTTMIVLAAVLCNGTVFAATPTYYCVGAANPKSFYLAKRPGNQFAIRIPAAGAAYDWRGELRIVPTYVSNTSSQYAGAVGAYPLVPGAIIPKALFFYSAIIPTNIINGTPGPNGISGGPVLVRQGNSPAFPYARYACTAAIAN